ncbi:MAG: ABC transporter permease subunit [Desulfobacteraceae bacterium]|nr:ABC transporter permease subunit [Desulfobacteraceae bacterium]
MNGSALAGYRSKANYYMWIGIFFALIGGIILMLYLATRQIDYVWRWYSMPRYFAHEAEIEIPAQVLGTVESITPEGKGAVIRVAEEDTDNVESYSVPDRKEIRVDDGDFVYPGDVLAIYRKWRPGLLAQGMWITLKVSLYAIVFGIAIGLLGGIARISSNPAAKWASITYVELIRGSPLLVQIFIWYFVLATLINQLLLKWGIPEISALWYGVASLAFFAGAYVTEIVRAGIQSIHRGQIEASRSLGMNAAQCMWYVILPQALRRILPPLAGQFITLIKDSSLLGIIAIRELTKATREGITTSLQPYEFWFTCAILYLILTFTLSMFVQWLERRTATP